jgi:iron complex outermembrane receptor protein
MKLFRFFSISISMAPLVHAQPQQLQRLVVDADREPVSKTVPTAAESRKELAKVPGGTEVVEADRYLRGRASTMADTFALSPGVVAQPRFGSDEARISIRGSGIQRTFHGRGIRLLQDGVPLNLADGGFDMQAVDPLATDYINVLRGGNALTLGSSTLGGAVDYISKTGLTAPGGSLRLEAGSYDYLRARVDTGVSEGNLDGYFSLSEAYQKGFRDHAEQNNQRLFSNFGWKINPTAETRVYFTAVNSESELPGNLTKAELEDDPRQQNSLPATIAWDQRRDFELYRIASKTTVVNGENTFDWIAAFSYKDLDHPIFQVIDQLSKDTLLGLTFTNRSALFGMENRLRTGAFFTHGSTAAAQYVNLPNTGRLGALTSFADQTATNFEGFVEDQLTLGNGFTGVIGATAAHNRRDSDVSVGTAKSYDTTYQDFSPKLGLRWDAPHFQVFGNVSSSYEPPSFSETTAGTVANDSQTADTIEIGTRGSYANMRWDATLYHSEVDGEFLALIDPVNNIPLGTVNADQTIHQGVEVFGEADLLGASFEDTPENRLMIRGAWTYGRFKFDGDDAFGDNTIAGLPPHLIRAEIIWENRQGYYAGPTFEWVPQGTYIDHANTFKADSYGLIGFKLGRRVEKGVSWFIEARNLTDEAYAATTGVAANVSGLDSRNFLPGDGRSVFAGLEWQW